MGNVSPTITVSHLRVGLLPETHNVNLKQIQSLKQIQELSFKQIPRAVDSPGDDDDEVHHVPHVPEVAPAVEDQAHRQDLQRRLHRENY